MGRSLVGVLVTGSHGRGPVAELIAGGVSGPLTRHSACPLLIVPPASEKVLLAGLTPVATEA